MDKGLNKKCPQKFLVEYPLSVCAALLLDLCPDENIALQKLQQHQKKIRKNTLDLCKEVGSEHLFYVLIFLTEYFVVSRPNPSKIKSLKICQSLHILKLSIYPILGYKIVKCLVGLLANLSSRHNIFIA